MKENLTTVEGRLQTNGPVVVLDVCCNCKTRRQRGRETGHGPSRAGWQHGSVGPTGGVKFNIRPRHY